MIKLKYFDVIENKDIIVVFNIFYFVDSKCWFICDIKYYKYYNSNDSIYYNCYYVYCRNDIYIEVYLLLVYNGFVELFIDMLIGIMEIKDLNLLSLFSLY